MNRYIDKASLIVAVITLVLFVAALLSKGITHDLFLEAGVFLVSVKIIIQGYTNSVAIGLLDKKVDALSAALTRNTDPSADPAAGSRARAKAGE
jgi:uncharacterized membrane protein